jgi:hypothetical protein
MANHTRRSNLGRAVDHAADCARRGNRRCHDAAGIDALHAASGVRACEISRPGKPRRSRPEHCCRAYDGPGQVTSLLAANLVYEVVALAALALRQAG